MTLGSLWPLALLAVAPLAWLGRSRLPGAGPRHRGAQAALRAAALACAALALAEPALWRASGELAVVALIDVSASAGDPAAAGEPLRRAAAAAGREPAATVVFAARTASAAAPDAASLAAAAAGLSRDATDLEGALQEAAARFPPHAAKRIALLSDGVETRGDAGRALWHLREAGVRVFAVPVSGARGAAVVGLELPEPPRAGQPFRAVVRVASATAARARVALGHAGERLAEREVALEPGVNRVALVARLAQPGESELVAEVAAERDPIGEDDRLRRGVWLAPRPRVLYLEGHPESARYLRRALEDAGFEVTVRGAEGARSEALDGHDVVILSDLPGERLREGFQEALRAFVREGGGLVFAGGEATYGEEGYAGGAVEATLPIRFRVREERRELALVIVLDKSYSMKGAKMELAKEATRAALELLEERHRFGVVSFDWDPYLTVPLQPAGPKPPIRDAIARIRASAQTNIYPALEEAHEQLSASPAEVKHVILLSDGKSYPDDYEALVSRMRAAGITVSTVAVGAEADRELLGAIAGWGAGRRYAIEDAARVQQIFVEETRRAVQATLVEEPFRPVVVRRSALLDGIDLDAAPPLRGYVSTRAREAAEVLLESPGEAPILARWNHGLGVALAFTSDVKDRWAAEWLDWPQYGAFWGQLVRAALRGRPPDPAVVRVTPRDGEARVELRLEGPLPPAGLGVRFGPLGREESFRPLTPAGEGRYEATIGVGPAEGVPWRFRIGGDGVPARALTLYRDLPDERRARPADLGRLREIAEATGGRLLSEPAAIFRPGPERVRAPLPLWRLLTAAALLLYLAELAVRRAPWFWSRLSGAAEPLRARPPRVGRRAPAQ